MDEGSTKDALNLCADLRERHPDALLVILAGRFDFDSVVNAFRWGIDGYIIKEISPEPLIGALRLVAMGEKVLPSEMATCLSDLPNPVGWSVNLSDVNLSEREVEVLQLLIQGSSNKVIGRHLGICEATVKVHVKAALRKLHVTNRTQAAIWAVRRGMKAIDPDSMAGPQLAARTASAIRSPQHPARVVALRCATILAAIICCPWWMSGELFT